MTLGSCWWAAVGLVACAVGCSRNEETVAITPEPTPSATAVSPESPPVTKPVFALVGEDTRLHAAADEAAPSFSPKEKGADAVVVLEIDTAEPEVAGWVRLRATERRSVCGYEPLMPSDPVYARASDLLPSLRATKVIESTDRKTRLELRPGVALHRMQAEGSYLVMTPEARAKIALDLAEVTAEVPAESFAAEPVAPDERDARARALDEASRYGMVGLFGGTQSPLFVGKLAVHLSKKRPPRLSSVEGDASLARLETPCLTLVGKRPPDPLAASSLRDAIGDSLAVESMLAGLGELNGGFDGAGWGTIGELSATGMGGLGTRSVGGEGTIGEGYGTIGHGTIGRGPGTGQGYGTGNGRLRPGRTATLRLDAIGVQGSLAPEIVQRLVRQRFSSLRACYEKGLGRDPALAGRVLLSFAVRPDGTVTTVKSLPLSETEPQGTDLADEAVVACVVSHVATVVFPKAEAMAHVRLPLVFAPGS